MRRFFLTVALRLIGAHEDWPWSVLVLWQLLS